MNTNLTPAVLTHIDSRSLVPNLLASGMTRVLETYPDVRFAIRRLCLFDTTVVMLTAEQPLSVSVQAVLALSNATCDRTLSLRAGCDLTAENDVIEVSLKSSRLTYALWQVTDMVVNAPRLYPQVNDIIDLVLPQVQRLTTALARMRAAIPPDADLPLIETTLRLAQAQRMQ